MPNIMSITNYSGQSFQTSFIPVACLPVNLLRVHIGIFKFPAKLDLWVQMMTNRRYEGFSYSYDTSPMTSESDWIPWGVLYTKITIFQ